MTKSLRRFEGRLFAEGGCLFLVVHADEESDTARVSCRMEGQTQVVDMPYGEVARRVSASTGLILDNLNGPEAVRRIVERKDGWYFTTREGEQGPFESHKDAGSQLARYILCMQTTAPAEPRGAEATPTENAAPAKAGAAERRRNGVQQENRASA